MLKFNNNNIFTGYLKQVLKDFNLPRYHVYTNYDKETNDKYIIPSYLPDFNSTTQSSLPILNPYIKDNEIKYYFKNASGGAKWSYLPKTFNSNKTISTNPEDLCVQHYTYNKKLKNITKNLIIKNNLYDSYTHEYLGDYLRFLRDYLNYDLMPMYNCFNNELCNNISVSWKNGDTTKTIEFATDSHYKIYMIPVKLFKEYTIAIDCNSPVEMFCACYGEYILDNTLNNTLAKLTYLHKNSISFNAPILFDKIKNIANNSSLEENEKETFLKFLAQNENDLKLFIKLPIRNTSSISILEGNYLRYNDNFLSCDNANYWNTKSSWKTGTNNKLYIIYDTESYAESLPTTNVETDDLALKYNDSTNYWQLYKYNDGWALESSTELYKILSNVALTKDGIFIRKNLPNFNERSFKAGDILIKGDINVSLPPQIVWEDIDIDGLITYLFELNNKTYYVKKNNTEYDISEDKEFTSKITTTVNKIFEVDEKVYMKVNESFGGTALDGIYLTYQYFIIRDATLYLGYSELTKSQNNYITNYEYEDSLKLFKPITSLQLLSINTHESYPFADKLINYLSLNVIDSQDEVGDNIKRVQKILSSNVAKDYNDLYNLVPGIWQESIRPIIYDFINENKKTNRFDINHDTFGYIDKEAEKYYFRYTDSTKKERETISSADIYEDEEE